MHTVTYLLPYYRSPNGTLEVTLKYDTEDIDTLTTVSFGSKQTSFILFFEILQDSPFGFEGCDAFLKSDDFLLA